MMRRELIAVPVLGFTSGCLQDIVGFGQGEIDKTTLEVSSLVSEEIGISIMLEEGEETIIDEEFTLSDYGDEEFDLDVPEKEYAVEVNVPKIDRQSHIWDVHYCGSRLLVVISHEQFRFSNARCSRFVSVD